jgi:HAD superfamily hydrolase (TIGR01509 family)
MDGTLIDTEPYWIRCEQELIAAYGGRWTHEDAVSIVGFDLMDAAEVIRTRGGVPLRPHEIVDKLSAAVTAMVRERVPWRPGARELLAALKLRGVPCALVTMSWRQPTEEVVRQLPPGSFQTVITGDQVMNGKPHPEPYRRAAEDLGVDPLSCVAIEDSPAGVASAEAAGCVVVAVHNLVPIPTAPHRVVLSTLEGVTPEVLGEYIERTPPPPARSSTEAPTRRPQRKRSAAAATPGRWWVFGAVAAAVLLLAAGIWWFAIRDAGPSHEPGPFNVHAWFPGWELEAELDDFAPRSNLLHQVSPFWYGVTGLTTVQLFDDTDEELVDEFYEQARDRGVPLVPTLTDDTAPGVMAAILADPASRAAHVDAIADFAAERGVQGIDINYENFAFEDGRDTWETTRPNWVSFIAELGERLHADGRILTVSVPPVYDDERTDDSGYWVYDYGGIAPHVDAIRIMAYDFSTDRPGPISPLDWVDDIIDGSTDAAGGPEKLVLGIPLYGRNWVIATTGDCPPTAAPPVQNPRLSAIPELIERREADPIHNSETDEMSFTYQVSYEEGEQSCTQSREVHYVDVDGAQRRMQRSIDAGFLGVALFAFGYENDGVWTSIEEINATLPTTTVAVDDAAATTTSAAVTTAAATATPTSAAAATTTMEATPTTTVAPTTTRATTAPTTTGA